METGIQGSYLRIQRVFKDRVSFSLWPRILLSTKFGPSSWYAHDRILERCGESR